MKTFYYFQIAVSSLKEEDYLLQLPYVFCRLDTFLAVLASELFLSIKKTFKGMRSFYLVMKTNR